MALRNVPQMGCPNSWRVSWFQSPSTNGMMTGAWGVTWTKAITALLRVKGKPMDPMVLGISECYGVLGHGNIWGGFSRIFFVESMEISWLIIGKSRGNGNIWGFPDNGGTPVAGWFLSWKIPSING